MSHLLKIVKKMCFLECPLQSLQQSAILMVEISRNTEKEEHYG